MTRPTQLIIDLNALRHNHERVRALAPQRSIMSMVKANAYGHGIIRVAEALDSTDAFGVASLDEAIKLRDAGIKQPIVLIEGLFNADELAEAAQYDLTLVVHHEPHIEMLEKAKSKHAFFVWLKINTGMHRLGINPADFEKFYQRLSALKSVKQIGLMTHFADADTLESKATRQQINRFTELTQSSKNLRSLANSAGILAWPESLGDWVRPGLMLYGASPFADKVGGAHDLQPVMSLQSHLIAITRVSKGGKVGYSGTWTAPEEMNIGVVGVGYGDGYPQFAENGTPVLVNNKECPLVGRVSMDMLTVDLRSQPEANIGDPVTLWGVHLPVERVARHCHTSAYEMLTRMTPRPKIEVVGT